MVPHECTELSCYTRLFYVPTRPDKIKNLEQIRKIVVFWDVVSCSLVEIYLHFEENIVTHSTMQMTKTLANKYSVNFDRLHNITPQKAAVFKDTAVMVSNVHV
jgi:hypothetical protein